VEVKIEKNVPIPPTTKQVSKYSYLNRIIETWEVGDSVAFKCGAKKKGVRSVATMARSYSSEAMSFCRKAQEANQKITRRSVPSEGVVRVWRVE
jgi:hypothetical protein